MSKFFDSELIQEELEEINELQRFIYGSILSFGSMTREDKLEHIEKMTSLSDDPQAVEMKENLKKSVAIMGFPPDTDISLLFNSMNKTIESLKQFIDR